MEITQRLWQLATSELIRSNADPKHPFKKAVLTTLGIFPESRWVVKRDYNSEDHTILIYTDRRSSKVSQIEVNNKVTLLFYHPKKKIQIRIYALAELHSKGSLYEAHLDKVRNHPKDYSTLLAPGFVLNGELKYGSDINFTLLVVKPILWDVLELGKERHYRVRYELEGNKWHGTELVP